MMHMHALYQCIGVFVLRAALMTECGFPLLLLTGFLFFAAAVGLSLYSIKLVINSNFVAFFVFVSLVMKHI